MITKIIYSNPIRYEVDGVPMDEEAYRELTQHADEQRLLEMLESGRGPHCVTDSTFLKDSENGRQFADCPHIGDAYKARCEANGGSVKGKKYLSQLARYPGDPRAWVSGRGDIQRICEEDGSTCDGLVKVKGRQPREAPKPGPELAADIVEEKVNEICDGLPNQRFIDRQDLREQIIEKHRYKKKKKV